MRGRLAKVAALTLVALAGTAYTFGGWAVVTVENLPEYAVAGKPVELTFYVRQHGVSLMSKLTPSIRATDGRQTVNAAAVERPEAGRYTSTFTLPHAGDWKISIQSGFMGMKSDLAPIAVIPSGSAPPAPQPLPVRGQHLFVAKGCASCHVHGAVAGSGALQVGPDLTPKRYQAEYLAAFLADPSIARTPGSSTARMPKLELKPAEITALTAFLNADHAVARRRGTR